ncbi:asparaginase [Paludibaculum fermentans]|uniref:asparaginase n=1 Tax=Paludibaculum fermentans TaxID=1473598 RepID=UPI003EB9261B
MPRVLFVFTGGTISMRFDPATGGAVPALSGEEILAYDPGLRTFADLEVIDFGRFPGPHMTPERMWALSELIARELARPEIDGIVVTHGTDTLEETAYLLDLRHTSPKPVAFVGAIRNSSELGYDGPANLRAALRTVIQPQAGNQGVFVVLNQMIHAASEVTKTSTQQLDTFQSPLFGPLGMVDDDRVLFARQLTARTTVVTSAWETRVEIVAMYAGADSRFIDYAREQGAQGLVIEGTGRGNVPPAAVPGIQRTLDAGLPIVIASRCAHGRILDTYAYAGSGHDLRQRGVLLAGTLHPAKARIKLMLALGRTRDPVELRSLIEAGSY